MPSQSPLRARLADAVRYRAEVFARAERLDSTVYHSRAVHCNVPLQDHRAKHVMLRFQMTLVGSSRKAGTANLTVDATTLLVGGCYSLRLVIGILLLCVTLSYPPRNTHHDFRLGGVREKTDPFKQSDEDIEGLLQPNWVPRGNEPVVDVKRHQYFDHTIPEPIASSFFTKRLVEPLSDYGIDAHVKHKRREGTPLGDAASGAKRLPIITPGPAYQNGSLPEMLLEGEQFWSNPIGRQNLECSLPIKRVVGFLQIYLDLVERALIAPSQTLVEFGFDCGGPRSPSRKSAMEVWCTPTWAKK